MRRKILWNRRDLGQIPSGGFCRLPSNASQATYLLNRFNNLLKLNPCKTVPNPGNLEQDDQPARHLADQETLSSAVKQNLKLIFNEKHLG